ncbi:uncharacterized protein PHALS_12404 [Plasmopara halstedii]|uniref:BZIP domain-containing protein n=1 Tax=Plasmopara halstedii TaxID=4781 RepID=A0A0P1AMT5_PLAHL|nr:uncharacterized protein PHALS_12404 [Plasmopara halstedii]CEG42100.1 hypothetical protein PHALS_12404 [Plasmopara halstedii]|eukprot:XP_024578469.1 hypothetical protein PHALS_12404 [Plasmopara halstedii]
MVANQLSTKEQHRRERNRSKVRRSYYRKIFNLARLRAQVETLEYKFEQLLQAQERKAASHVVQELNGMLTEAETLSIKLGSLGGQKYLKELTAIEPLPLVTANNFSAGRVKRLLQLARIRKALYEENESLRDRGRIFAKAYSNLQHLMDVYAVENHENDILFKRTQLMVLRKLKLEECLEINRVAYGRITAFIEKQRWKPPKGATLGWTDRRRLENGVLTFYFSKFFANRSSTQLAELTWQLTADVNYARRFFSVYLNVDVHIVQHIDDSNVVCMRTVNQSDHDVVIKSLYLLTRFKTEKGIILLKHGLDPSRLEDDFTKLARVGKSEVWQDEFCWILLEDEKHGCRMSLGGMALVEHPWEQFWLCEVLLLTLRWESVVVAPLFSLRCN